MAHSCFEVQCRHQMRYLILLFSLQELIHTYMNSSRINPHIVHQPNSIQQTWAFPPQIQPVSCWRKFSRVHMCFLFAHSLIYFPGNRGKKTIWLVDTCLTHGKQRYICPSTFFKQLFNISHVLCWKHDKDLAFLAADSVARFQERSKKQVVKPSRCQCETFNSQTNNLVWLEMIVAVSWREYDAL